MNIWFAKEKKSTLTAHIMVSMGCLLVGALSFLAIGCESLPLKSTDTTSSCEHIDWFEVGRIDGASGLVIEKMTEYKSRCSSTPHPMSEELYVNGRNAGLLDYCTPSNGFETGKNGVAYEGVCPSPLDESFLTHYKVGARVYELESENNDLEERIDSLIRVSIPNQTNSSVRSKIDQLRSRRAKNDSEIKNLEQSTDSGQSL